MEVNPIKKKGCLLASLDSEILLPENKFNTAIIIHGLFNRRIVLSDAHALDNPLFSSFLKRNESILSEEEISSDCSPLFSSCGKADQDPWKAIDLYLLPKGPFQAPTYLSSLSPRQNAELQADYNKLKSKIQRRNKLIKIKGELYKNHIDRYKKYLKKHIDCKLENMAKWTFFDSAKNALNSIRKIPISDTEKTIVEKMLKKIDGWKPDEGYQSRERLHEAIYPDGIVPRVYGGSIMSKNDVENRQLTSWRYLVNALHNLYHAEITGVDAVTSPELRLPEKLLKKTDILKMRKFSDKKLLKIETSLHYDFLDLPFLISLRREPVFWDNIKEIESGQNTQKAIENHIQFISSHFARYLIDNKSRPDLVKTTKASIWITEFNKIFAPLSLGAFGMLISGCDAVPQFFSTLSFLYLATGLAISGVFDNNYLQAPKYRSFTLKLEEAAKSYFQD